MALLFGLLTKKRYGLAVAAALLLFLFFCFVSILPSQVVSQMPILRDLLSGMPFLASLLGHNPAELSPKLNPKTMNRLFASKEGGEGEDSFRFKTRGQGDGGRDDSLGLVQSNPLVMQGMTDEEGAIGSLRRRKPGSGPDGSVSGGGGVRPGPDGNCPKTHPHKRGELCHEKPGPEEGIAERTPDKEKWSDWLSGRMGNIFGRGPASGGAQDPGSMLRTGTGRRTLQIEGGVSGGGGQLGRPSKGKGRLAGYNLRRARSDRASSSLKLKAGLKKDAVYQTAYARTAGGQGAANWIGSGDDSVVAGRAAYTGERGPKINVTTPGTWTPTTPPGTTPTSPPPTTPTTPPCDPTDPQCDACLKVANECKKAQADYGQKQKDLMIQLDDEEKQRLTLMGQLGDLTAKADEVKAGVDAGREELGVMAQAVDASALQVDTDYPKLQQLYQDVESMIAKLGKKPDCCNKKGVKKYNTLIDQIVGRINGEILPQNTQLQQTIQTEIIDKINTEMVPKIQEVQLLITGEGFPTIDAITTLIDSQIVPLLDEMETQCKQYNDLGKLIDKACCQPAKCPGTCNPIKPLDCNMYVQYRNDALATKDSYLAMKAEFEAVLEELTALEEKYFLVRDKYQQLKDKLLVEQGQWQQKIPQVQGKKMKACKLKMCGYGPCYQCILNFMF